MRVSRGVIGGPDPLGNHKIYGLLLKLAFSGDKSLTFLPVSRWQLNCHYFWYKLTLIFVLKQYEISVINP